MRKIILVSFFLISSFGNAQNYRFLGADSGLSSCKVYSIQEDKTGYMWFLTHKGIDRYDGRHFKHYIINNEGNDLGFPQHFSRLFVDRKGNLWKIGREGRICEYEPSSDSFRLACKLPEEEYEDDPAPVTCNFIDKSGLIWMCGEQKIYLYDMEAKTLRHIVNNAGTITGIAQYNDDHFFIGTTKGVRFAGLHDGKLNIISKEGLNELSPEVSELYYDSITNQLFAGTYQDGVDVYDWGKKKWRKIEAKIKDIPVTRIRPLDGENLLIATDGAGIIKINKRTCESDPIFSAQYNDNVLNGHSVSDAYIDKAGRIWIANFPFGVTIWDGRNFRQHWYRPKAGDPQSLVNDCVNYILEDSDGDLWFATNNGISLYKGKTKKWKSFLNSTGASSFPTKKNVFYSLCEISPGVICAGGYGPTISLINKKTMNVDYIHTGTPEKFIHSIAKDSKGDVWLGGYSQLTRLSMAKNNEISVYPDIDCVDVILEKDKENLWVGTGKGLYILNKNTGQAKKIKTPVESAYIYSLCQTNDGKLYVGTNGSGLFVYHPEDSGFLHFHKGNSALPSNNVYTILSNGDNSITFSTESGLTRFFPYKNNFQNWTKEQGLKTNTFNPNSGTSRKNGTFVFGGINGAVEFDKKMKLPQSDSSKLVFSEFSLFYQSSHPGSGSPLKENINYTKELVLKHNENTFSIQISSINYDSSTANLYTWKLDGFCEEWCKPSEDNVIQFTNLSPGKYVLHVRAISNETRRVIEERTMKITIKPPFTKTVWAYILYALLLAGIIGIVVRLLYIRRQRRLSYEKVQLFINTAHDISIPLTLIKAPLEEIKARESLSKSGNINMNTAIRNVKELLAVSKNMIDYGRTDSTHGLVISEHELNAFLKDIVLSFRAYSERMNIDLTYNSNFERLNVWFDKEKMDSILRNIISNAVKFTPENGSVSIRAEEKPNSWSLEVRDTGIGVPAKEQKKLFKKNFRGSNAVASNIEGSGVGIALTGKLIKLHKGKISLSSKEKEGTVIKLSFPRKYNRKVQSISLPGDESGHPETQADRGETVRLSHPNQGERILVVEDNEELLNYLEQILSEKYAVIPCSNGSEALEIIRERKPEMVIADIVMPEMRGDELCRIIKDDIEISHIPVILLTALNDETNILKGLEAGADEYIVKPFNAGILKATITNILNSRKILRNKYANLDFKDMGEKQSMNRATELDFKFISSIKANVEKHMDDPSFNVDTLCHLMSMSRTRFYTKLKDLTDMAPSDYVRLIKLLKAAELLKEGGRTVTEVAEMTGFSDAKYFREVFKKYFRVSPSKYKG